MPTTWRPATRHSVETPPPRSLLTNFIVAEWHALALSRLDAAIVRRWLLGNVWPVERITVEDEAKAMTIVGRYIDKAVSYTDATSFAVMERPGLKTAFALAPHFHQYGFQVIGIPLR